MALNLLIKWKYQRELLFVDKHEVLVGDSGRNCIIDKLIVLIIFSIVDSLVYLFLNYQIPFVHHCHHQFPHHPTYFRYLLK